MEIRFLGPFEVVDDEGPILLGGRKQRALLAILAIHAGEVVPVGRLIDELWPESPPDSATNALQAYVSRLRRALRKDQNGGAPEPILFEHGGYLFDVSKYEIDSTRFADLVALGERHARDGDAEAAADILRQALGLWRGQALADFAQETFARPEIARLEEHRLAAIESRIDADLACGRHAALVGELEALVTEHPHREGFRRQLMLALYLSGRQGDALAAYADARATLDADLGVEPTTELRELQLAILNQDPALGKPGRVRTSYASRRSRRWTWAAMAAASILLAVAAAAVLRRSSHGSAVVHVVRNSVAVVDARTDAVIDDIVVGDYPGPVAAGSGSVWVGNIGDSTVTEIHGDTRQAEFPASAQRPVDLAVTPDALWIANASDFATQPPTGGGTVVRRTLASGELETTRLGPLQTPDEMKTFVASDGRTVWAANANSRTVAKLDPRTGRVLVRVPGLVSGGLASGYGAVWVPEPERDLLVRLDARTGKVEARIPVSGNPQRVAVGEGAVWVVTTGAHSAVWRIDSANNETVAVIPVPPKARRIATGNGYVWVTSGRSNEEAAHRPGLLSKIDPRKNGIVASVELGFRPDGVAVAGKLVWVAIAPL